MISSPFFREGRISMSKLHVATNADLLEAWRAAVRRRYRGKTVLAYTEGAERLFEFLDERKWALAGLSAQALCDYLCARAASCRHLGRLDRKFYCRVDAFAPSPDVPRVCGFACSMYEEIKADSYAGTEKALARLFEFASRETTALPTNVFPEVRARIRETMRNRRLSEREDARYPRRALTRDEVAALFRTSRHPRDRFVLALMFKTGVRHGEALQIPDGAELRASWACERIITIEREDGIKRLGNPHLIIDDQLWSILEEYFAWKERVLRAEPKDDPRRSTLLLSKRGDRVLASTGMASLWADAGARAGIKISAVQDAPLTPHSARHTFCRLLEEAGFTPFWIARLRGDVQAPDASLKSAWTYAKRSPTELRTEYFERFPMLPI